MWWFGTARQQTITWTNVDRVQWRHHKSPLRHNEFIGVWNIAGDVFKLIFLNENVRIFIQIFT